MIVSPVIKPVVSAVIKGLFGNQDAADPLVFHALTHAGASGGVDAAGNTLLPYEGVDVLRGIGTLTEARTSTNYAPDHEGVWRSWGSGEAVREGFRQVENILTYSEAPETLGWTKNNCTVATGAADPDGGATAVTVTATGANAQYYYTLLNSGTVQADPRINSIYIKRRTGSGGVAIREPDGTHTDVAISSSWQRFSVSGIGAGGAIASVGVRVSVSGDEVDIAFCQHEVATGRTNTTNPSEYVPTTTAAAKKFFASTNPWEVTSNVATATATVTELTDIWTKGEPAHTNSLPYSKPDTTNWSLTEGSAGDLVTNGTFDTDTDWTKGTGWSIAAGVASCDGTQTTVSHLSQTAIQTSGKIYKATFTVSNYSAGQVRIQMDGADGPQRSANGTYTQYLAPSGATLFRLQADADFIGDIDNVIVQPCVIESYTTGLTGAADSAVVLTDDDGSVGEVVYYQTSITPSNSTNIGRFWVKKDSDETRFPLIGVKAVGGGADIYAYFFINTATGVTAAFDTVSNDASASVEVRDTGHGWYEVLVSLTFTTSHTSALSVIFPARGDVIGTTSTAATGSVTIADPVELHLNTTIAAVRGSSPIFTSGAAASTVATSLSFDDANHDDTQGGWYAEFQKFTASGSSLFGYEGIVGTSASQIGGQLVFRDSAPYNYLMSDDGTNRATSDGGITAETTKKVACAYGDNLRANNDGSWGAETSYDGGFGTVGSIKVAAVGMITGPILIRNIKRWNADYTTAQSLIDSEML